MDVADIRRTGGVSALTEAVPKPDSLGELLIQRIGAPRVGHDIWHTHFGGCVDQFRLRVRRRPDAQRDDEDLLALEGRDKRRLIVVVDSGGSNARGKVGPFTSRDGRHRVLASLGQGCG